MRCTLLLISHGDFTGGKRAQNSHHGRVRRLSPGGAAEDLKIALIYGKTGPLEAYAKQTETGLRLGFEYATKGTMMVDGRKIVLITKDDQTKPDVAKTAARGSL